MMLLKVYLTLDIDSEEYPIPADGAVDLEVDSAFREYIHDIDGMNIKNMKIVMGDDR